MFGRVAPRGPRTDAINWSLALSKTSPAIGQQGIKDERMFADETSDSDARFMQDTGSLGYSSTSRPIQPCHAHCSDMQCHIQLVAEGFKQNDSCECGLHIRFILASD